MLTLALVVVGPLTCAGLVAAGRRAAVADRARVLGSRPRWRIPSRVRDPLAGALASADATWTPEDAVVGWGVGIAAAALVGTAFSPVVAVPATVAAVAGGPLTLVLARTRRERAFLAALPGALEQVAAELRGGGTVAAAVERLACGGGSVAADLQRVRVRTQLGLPLADALAGWPTDHDAPGVRAAAGALAVAATMGGRAADAIDGLASSLRHRLDAIAEAHALSAQARLSAWVVGAAPIAYLAFSALVDPDAVTVLVATGVGRVCLVVGLMLEALAALWIRRTLRSAG